MSSASTNQRRAFDSPCEYTYVRVWCLCAYPSRTRTDVQFSEDPVDQGKLCYVCSRCRLFRGWLVPLRLGETTADVEPNYRPDTSPVIPSPISYQGARCRRGQYRRDAIIKISSSTDNHGKLYYTCFACKQFAAWCVPVDSGPEISISRSERPVSINVLAVEKFFGDVKTMLGQMLLLNLMLCVLLLVLVFLHLM